MVVGPNHLCHPRWGQLLTDRSLKVRCCLDLYQTFAIFERGTSKKLMNNLRGQGLVAVADDGSYTWHACQVLWCTLCIAAGHHNLCFRIEPVRTPDEGPRRSVGLRRYAARVHDHNVSGVGFACIESLGTEAAAYRLSVGSRRPATEIFHMKAGRHAYSLLPAPISECRLRYTGDDQSIPRSAIYRMASPSSADGPTPLPKVIKGSSRHIIGFVYFTFIAYLSIGLPLAVLPPYVHLRMGYSATLAGLVISIQYMATLVSRPWAGRISDRAGAKVSVLWGMAACSVSGGVLTAAALLHAIPWLSLTVLLVSRLLLGIGESLGSTGSTLWGISSAGQANMAKVISFNGIATYGAMALGAPLGVILDQYGGLGGIGLLILLIGAFSLVLASRKSPVPVTHGEHLPFRDVMFRVAPHGFGLALGGVGFSVLATFVTLFYASRHWTGGALCLTAFGAAFIAARLIFIQAINRYGGFPVGMACLSVESLGLLLLWRANAPWIALGAAALTGFGFSLVFPAIGVEAVKRVPVYCRGTALGVYTAFSDVSFFLVGPVAGAVIGGFGYASVFLLGLGCVLAALGIVVVLRQFQSQ